MFLLVLAHPGFPGQIPQSRKTVVCVCVCVRVSMSGGGTNTIWTFFDKCELTNNRFGFDFGFCQNWSQFWLGFGYGQN